MSIRAFDAAAAVADLDGEVVVDGIDATVQIRRDGHGIAHVEATTVHDLFFGQGFATAQDRLWHLEWDRRKAAGRCAELIGSAANVATDCFHRRARLVDRARAGYAALDDETRSILDAHAAGISAFMACTTARPVEFQALGCADEPWEGWHAVAIFLVRHVTFATWQTKLWNARVLAALGPEAMRSFRLEGRRGDTPLIVPPGARAAVGPLTDAGLFDPDTPSAAPVGADATLAGLEPLGLQQSGSNAWVVDGSRTSTGLPMIGGDPHRPFEVPNVYAQIHLVGPGIDAAGFSFPGVPGVPHFAQTTRVAWAVTNAMADYQDLYVEALPGAAIDTRVETVTVRGNDGSTESIEVECVLTAHGPVVLGSTAHGVGVALASTGLEHAGGSLRSTLPMLRARTVADLDAALAHWVEPANNVVLADVDGHIAYRTAGRIPVRHRLNSVLPVSGADAGYDWTGHVPDDALPRASDPATGAIVTANQRITERDHASRLNDDAYGPARADRIWARLDACAELGVDDMAAIHADTICTPAIALAARIAAADSDAAAVLEGWDGSMTVSSRAAALVAQVRHHLCILVAARLPEALRSNPFARWEPPATALSAEMRVANAIGNWIALDERDDDTTIVGPDGWAPLIAEATRLARDVVADATWGDIHEATPLHPARALDDELGRLFRPTSGPVAGGSDCVMAMNQVGGVSTNAFSGSTARYVWDLADRANSGWISPLGASGHPASPHFRDQTEAWASGRLVPVIDPTTTSLVHLHPG